ncbi:copper resistance CopC family protein [Sphaerisporangium fuscum]|uniref:copper resistance CopC family protein n=1 Tax=Sphaerisporangium fuscum TaxID=2835868 RepID=UPI001BDC0B78|nr:copper resistance CopC family protein [Sphaerisporangium fuscum]
MRRLLTVLLAACAALAVAAGPAQAHNVLTGSDPKDGARLASVPSRVTLTFDQPVRADFAQVVLTGPDGVATKAEVEVAEEKVMATVPGASPAGSYLVGYQIVSNDGHPVSGQIRFTVGDAPAQSPAAQPTGSPSPAAQAPSAGPSSAGAPGGTVAVSAAPPASSGSWVWGLLLVALLLSGLGIWVVARGPKGQGA